MSRKAYGKPFFLIRPLIALFGIYSQECWMNDGEFEEGGLYYTLFGVKVQYGTYFEKWD